MVSPTLYFYPRSPCGERRGNRKAYVGNSLFLSTLSLRRATYTAIVCTSYSKFLSTLSLRRATPFSRSDPMTRRYFYPRSPCGERRTVTARIIDPTYDFYPRSPCGERPSQWRTLARGIYDFYPRSPCGERLFTFFWLGLHANFYPRSPCGERPISDSAIMWAFDFYPRSPCGERQRVVSRNALHELFLSTLSLRRATVRHRSSPRFKKYFYPRSPCGERPNAR